MKIGPSAGTRWCSSAASTDAWAASKRMRQPILLISCTDGEACWPSVRRTTKWLLHAIGNPLLRPSLRNACEVSRARFLILDLHGARDLDTLRLRRTSAVQAFGKIADSVAADGHVLD